MTQCGVGYSISGVSEVGRSLPWLLVCGDTSGVAIDRLRILSVVIEHSAAPARRMGRRFHVDSRAAFSAFNSLIKLAGWLGDFRPFKPRCIANACWRRIFAALQFGS